VTPVKRPDDEAGESALKDLEVNPRSLLMGKLWVYFERITPGFLPI
jgi:hypothetical protein